MTHETLSNAIDQVRNEIIDRDIALTEDVRCQFENAFVYGGIAYGQTKRASFEIATIRGRTTRKYLHVIVYRFETGRYELTYYVG